MAQPMRPRTPSLLEIENPEVAQRRQQEEQLMALQSAASQFGPAVGGAVAPAMRAAVSPPGILPPELERQPGLPRDPAQSDSWPNIPGAMGQAATDVARQPAPMDASQFGPEMPGVRKPQGRWNKIGQAMLRDILPAVGVGIAANQGRGGDPWMSFANSFGAVSAIPFQQAQQRRQLEMMDRDARMKDIEIANKQTEGQLKQYELESGKPSEVDLQKANADLKRYQAIHTQEKARSARALQAGSVAQQNATTNEALARAAEFAARTKFINEQMAEGKPRAEAEKIANEAARAAAQARAAEAQAQYAPDVAASQIKRNQQQGQAALMNAQTAQGRAATAERVAESRIEAQQTAAEAQQMAMQGKKSNGLRLLMDNLSKSQAKARETVAPLQQAMAVAGADDKIALQTEIDSIREQHEEMVNIYKRSIAAYAKDNKMYDPVSGINYGEGGDGGRGDSPRTGPSRGAARPGGGGVAATPAEAGSMGGGDDRTDFEKWRSRRP